jgi:hypothetical protein
MSTKSNGTSTRTGSARADNVAPARERQFVLCLRNSGYEASLELRKVYAVVPDSTAAAHDQMRIIDESGEDYLFPRSLFATIKLPAALQRALLAAG